MTDKEKADLINTWMLQHDAYYNSMRYKIEDFVVKIILVLTFPIWIFPLIIMLFFEYRDLKNNKII